MISNTLRLAIMEGELAVKALTAKQPDASLEDRLRASFAATRHHWAIHTDDETFRAGVGGVLVHASPDEQARINAELMRLHSIGAAMEGIPVDIEAAFAAEDGPKPIGMLAIWREVAGGQRG